MIQIHNNIFALPTIHGRVEFSLYLRNWLSTNSVDAIALELPEATEDHLLSAVHELPILQTILLQYTEQWQMIPIDPSDAMIEAIRQGEQHNTPVYFVDSNEEASESQSPWLPDPYALRQISLEQYIALCEPLLPTSQDSRDSHMAYRLLELSKKHSKILWIGGMAHLKGIQEHLSKSPSLTHCEPPLVHKSTLNPKHAYFALGELPFITGLWEKSRFDPFAETPHIPLQIKELFQHTRKNFLEKKSNQPQSLTRLNKVLDYISRLTHQQGRITPDLITLVEASQGVFGDDFAIKILQAAKDYPYLDPMSESPMLELGPEFAKHPIHSLEKALNRFQDTPLIWENLKLKSKPTLEKKEQYKYDWNTQNMCSHLPEDISIERFNQSVRRLAQKQISEALTKTEEFTSSLKDGLDVRETLRNWHSGKIYVKEDPGQLGQLDTVVILFDQENDSKYPHQMVWSAEHLDESTLTFYGTDPFEELIGPGIAQAQYGGLSLLFPPRPVPNPFISSVTQHFNLADKILFGALLNSLDTNVAFVSPIPPNLKQKKLAQQFKKHLLWIPLHHFNEDTIERVRKFHILNGQEIRSFATRFIGY